MYQKEDIKKHISDKILMDRDMGHVSYYLSGKAVKRELLTPIQLDVDPKISLGEDLCCVFPLYLKAQSVYISKKAVYLYTVRNTSLSKKFNTNQIFLIENVINVLDKKEEGILSDYDEQKSRYSCFMCFAILAAAAEKGKLSYATELKKNILESGHYKRIKKAQFGNITVKSRIAISLMKKKMLITAFVFLSLCDKIKRILKKG